MALTKTDTIDKIEILENGIVQYRRVIRVFDDGELIGERYHRDPPLEPGQDVSTMPTKVQDICKAVWTQTVIDDFMRAKNSTTRLPASTTTTRLL